MELADHDPPRGLTAEEARRRLSADGPNELTVTQGSSLLQALISLWRQPLFVLLFAAAAVYLWLGDRIEALALVASIVVAAAITVFQRVRTERVLVALRDLASPRALVRRDGAVQRIAGREVVRGDCILLREGDRVPADAQVTEAHNLLVDESLLTGESVAVNKFGGAVVFANTLVVSGQATAFVSATGARTQFGLIGSAIQRLDDATTPLQRDTAQLARGFGAAGALLSVLLVLGHGLLQGQWTEGVLRGLTLAMAILPEEFPLVITVFLALGAWRLAKQQVLTRRPGAIEALGATTLLCVDKTGTLTVNRMQLAHAVAADGVAAPRLAKTALLACEPQPFDPMELACQRWAIDVGATLPPAGELKRRYPLSERRLLVGHAWQRIEGVRIAVKGAPEHVLELCRLAGEQREAVLQAVRRMADDGIRLLAVAEADADAPPDELATLDFAFVGLIGFRDPLRPEVPQAVRECHRAGIRVLMITGDYPATAAAIAREAGLAAEPRVATGDELGGWSDAELAARLRTIDVVARATPLAKLRLVQVMQGAGEVVAMTGDGVNDAPALRAAHIGVAMGERGSDVAREAASLVLLRDDFQSLVAAVRQGRRIFANLRQALLYVLAVHVPMIGMSLLPLLIGAPPVLLPLHVMFLEFVIDPACSLVFEAELEGRGTMARPPRPVREHVLGMGQMLAAFTQGGLAFAAAAAAYLLALHDGSSEAATRTVAMSAVVVMNLVLILHNRSAERELLARLRSPNPMFWAVASATVLAWSTVLAVPSLRGLFRLEAPSAAMLGWLIPPLILAAAALEMFGRWRRRASARAAQRTAVGENVARSS
jgi:Ca2+-transporting ATPase